MNQRKRVDHYHVLTGLPGYLPNDNQPCETLREAGQNAHQQAESFRDAGYASCWGKDSQGRVTGNMRDGYDVLRESLASLGETIVWQTITISRCNEPECRCEKCGQLLYEDDVCSECDYQGREIWA